MCNWAEQRLEPPESKEKCFVFTATCQARITGYVWAKDAGEAVAMIENGEWEGLDDWDFIDYFEVDDIKEE